MSRIEIKKDLSVPEHIVTLYGCDPVLLSETLIREFAADNNTIAFEKFQAAVTAIEPDHGKFSVYNHEQQFDVSVLREDDRLILACSCDQHQALLCRHQSDVLIKIVRDKDIRAFYDTNLRNDLLKKTAASYGLADEPAESFFSIVYADSRLSIVPKQAGLFPVTRENILALNASVRSVTAPGDSSYITGVVFRQHKYYKNLVVGLFSAPVGKNGKIKNPVSSLEAGEMMWNSDDSRELKFFAGIRHFQHALDTARSEQDLTALRAIIANPLDYGFYIHDRSVSENLSTSSLKAVSVGLTGNSLTLNVRRKDQFYEFGIAVRVDGVGYDLKDLQPRFGYFLAVGEKLLLVESLQVLALIELIRKKGANLLVHVSQYRDFKRQLIEKLEDQLIVDYQYIKPATPGQLEEYEAESELEKIIYLSDFGSYVMIEPVMRYGEAEIPIRSQRQAYMTDKKGNEFMIYRDGHEEASFTALILRQHPFFREQEQNGLLYYYLHRKRFLEESWFLNTFEEWERANITVLGFSDLSGNKLNPNKIKVNVQVISGINWFNTIINARYGSRKASVKNIHRAIRNKTKYVLLDDGSLGIIPAEWLDRFSKYFSAGEVAGDDTLRTARTNFAAIERYYEESMLSEEVKADISGYRERLVAQTKRTTVIPGGLNAELRDYQVKGLEWLLSLDDLNFGGCLADDMGLGKSLQIIAFILWQRTKELRNVNLLVVPTSLTFNWEAEISKFAPSLRVKKLYGAKRARSSRDWENYEIILTTYGTLLSDIGLLREFAFNYIFLDESQNIKNPESQRYKAACSLRARNRIAITGTPVENNTFDLYGQLSFTCPGLLGSKRHFRDIYSTPIDRFHDSRRARELHDLIRPFILRRTKQQVASELPEKTEMVLYCQMGEEQQNIYDAYEKEFREFISATDNDHLKKSPMNVLKGLTRLRQICDSPLLLPDGKMTGESSAKITILMEQIENKRADHKILVFSQFVSMLDLIRAELVKKEIRFSYLTGQTTTRENIINEFQNDPGIRVFLISLKAGGTGLNLTAADYVYLVDPWWNPAVENQAIDRCHRIGQDKHIMAVRLICEGTVEEKIRKLQEKKKVLAKDMISTDENIVNSFSKEELLAILGNSPNIR